MITLRQATNGQARRINRAPSGKEFIMEGFLEPGLVSYEDSGAGVARLNKETIDGMLESFVGCPVTYFLEDGGGLNHPMESKDELVNGQISNEDGSPVVVGKVNRAWWNDKTGKYDCAFILNSEEYEGLLKENVSGSCAYNVTKSGPGGELHAMKYNEEILGGVFEHLALVDNPRYEDCKIRMNGKPAKIKENASLPKGWEVLPTRSQNPAMGHGFSIYKDGQLKKSSLPAVGFPTQEMALAQGRQEAEEMAAGWKKNAFDNLRSTYRGEQIEVRKEESGWIGVSKKLGLKTGPEKTAGEATNVLMAMIDDSSRNNNNNRQAMFDKERADHPEFTDEQIWKIVRDHEEKKNASLDENQRAVLKWMDDTNTGAIPREGKWYFKENIRLDANLARAIKEYLNLPAKENSVVFSNGRAGVFKKGETVRDINGVFCKIVGEAQSGEYYVVQYPDGSTDRMREGDLNLNAKAGGEITIKEVPGDRFPYKAYDSDGVVLYEGTDRNETKIRAAQEQRNRAEGRWDNGKVTLRESRTIELRQKQA